MKRLVYFTLSVMLIFTLSACSNNKAGSVSIDTDDIIVSSSVSTSAEESLSVSDDQITSASNEENNSSEPTDVETVESVADINEIPIKFVERFVGLTSFKGVTDGQTNAFITQKIDSVLIRNGDKVYFQTVSDSSLVHTSLTSYFYNGKVNYKYKDEDFTVVGLSEYLDKFGVNPVGRAIEGFVVNAETILSVEKLQTESNYSFKVRLDPDKSSAANKVQTKEFGGLGAEPVFKSVELVLTMDKYFNPITVELTTEYTINMLFDIDCVQHYIVTYTNVNGEVSVPDEQHFNQL